jgi:hypothetical protein
MPLTAASFGDYLEGEILNFIKGTTGAGTPFNGATAPANLYVGLLTSITAPANIDTGTAGAQQNGTEVTTTNGTGGWTAYARIAIPSSGWGAIAAAGGDATGQQIANSAALGGAATAWQNGGGSSVSIVAIGIYDAATAGNMWFYGTLTATQPIANGSAFSIGIGGIILADD